MSLFGNTILLSSDSAGAVSAVAIAILIGVPLRNGLAPLGTTLEVDVVDVGTGVDNIDVNTLAAISGVQVLVECAERKAVAVRDTSQTPWGVFLNLAVIVA